MCSLSAMQPPGRDAVVVAIKRPLAANCGRFGWNRTCASPLFDASAVAYALHRRKVRERIATAEAQWVVTSLLRRAIRRRSSGPPEAASVHAGSVSPPTHHLTKVGIGRPDRLARATAAAEGPAWPEWVERPVRARTGSTTVIATVLSVQHQQFGPAHLPPATLAAHASLRPEATRALTSPTTGTPSRSHRRFDRPAGASQRSGP